MPVVPAFILVVPQLILLPMLDQRFRNALEHKLCEVFKNAVMPDLKGFWCDGVILSEPEHHYLPQFVNASRQVRMRAFIGKNGQAPYDLILKFGNKAMSRYARGLDIINCIPAADITGRIAIDIPNQKIELQLD